MVLASSRKSALLRSTSLKTEEGLAAAFQPLPTAKSEAIADEARPALPVPGADAVPYFLTKKEVCAHVKLSFPTLWAMMRKGQFPQSIAVGGRTMWRAESVAEFMASCKPRSTLGRKSGGAK